MSGKQFWIAVLAAVIALGVFACAQDEKNQLSGLIGRTWVSNQGIQCGGCVNPNIEFGKGITIEANYSRLLKWTPLIAISGEVPFVYDFDQDLNAGENVVPTGYKYFFVTPAVRVNVFPSTAISPWVSFGGGPGRFSQDKDLVYGGPNPGSSNMTAAIEAGLGLDVRITHRFSLRGGVRDFWSGVPKFPLVTTGKSRQNNYFVGTGLIWRF